MSETKSKENSLDEAINACESNIKAHRKASMMAIFCAIFLLAGLFLFTAQYAILTSGTSDSERLALLNDVEEKELRITRLTEERYTDFSLERRQDELRVVISGLDEKPDDAKLIQSKTNLEEEISGIIKKYDERLISYQSDLEDAQMRLDEYIPKPILPNEIMLVLVSLTVIVISVFAALYRGHLNETTKNEHYLLGFYRVRIAANNAKLEGFQDDVRTLLVNGAFSIPSEKRSIAKDKVDSPLPGHPTSEIATKVVNILLEKSGRIIKKSSDEKKPNKSIQLTAEASAD
ncbi:hypothetical protein SG34_013610 [Thalassomonas viridans]|uniref:Uncharacterized protein n=1 Tax=Thalassomonas viridans TaxID=137584 RepID=A0AAE9Z7S4_9GAMM|nr:hypothetical protein [Thalassomonas viridans]WDE07822.1 hypothetical protein SG34_013610 [Thalassomonas viridans]